MASNLYTGLMRTSPILATAANSAARTITSAATNAVTTLLQPRAASQAVEPVLYSNIDLDALDNTVSHDTAVNVAMQGGRAPMLTSPVRLASSPTTLATPNDESLPPPYSSI